MGRPRIPQKLTSGEWEFCPNRYASDPRSIESVEIPRWVTWEYYRMKRALEDVARAINRQPDHDDIDPEDQPFKVCVKCWARLAIREPGKPGPRPPICWPCRREEIEQYGEGPPWYDTPEDERWGTLDPNDMTFTPYKPDE